MLYEVDKSRVCPLANCQLSKKKKKKNGSQVRPRHNAGAVQSGQPAPLSAL